MNPPVKHLHEAQKLHPALGWMGRVLGTMDDLLDKWMGGSDHSDVQTSYRLISVGGKLRFEFRFNSPVRLLRNGRGEYDDVAGTVQIAMQWSSDNIRWHNYRFEDSPNPEVVIGDGTYAYAAISNVPFRPYRSQFARLAVHHMSKKPQQLACL